MVIECSSCQARFKLADDKIKESGTKVRCTKCREVFTVFPEKPPEIAPPVIVAAPVVDNEKDVISDDFFSMEDKSPVAPEIPFSAVDVPVSSTDDWNQEAESSFFADDAGTSDLDAINFDNFEPPVFSVPKDTSGEFEFNDDSAFSFEDSSLEIGVERHQLAAQTEEQLPSTETAIDFEADFSPSPPPISAPEEPSQTRITTDGDFTFSEAESPSDFSWGETSMTPQEPAVADNFQEKKPTTTQNTDFDFGSFSFDQEPEPESVISDEKQQEDTVATYNVSESSIELSLDTETSVAPILIRPAPTSTVAKDRESTSPSARPLRPRPRSRQSKKGLSHLIVKVSVTVLFALVLVFGFMNREQLQKEYKNLVSGFIEKQVPVEISGQIGLEKLSGKYLTNRQEGELFVIRGVAINEFKELRSSVLVRGTIYGENGAALQSQSAYCGNSMKDDSLKISGFKEIREVMNNELGENLINLNIAVGKSVPCMIVFNKVPPNIKEFTVEVVDSKTGSK